MAWFTARRITFASTILLQKKVLLLTSTAQFAHVFPARGTISTIRHIPKVTPRHFTALTRTGRQTPGIDKCTWY